MNIGYVRVSTVDQNEARQVEALKKYDIEKWYSEKVSGKDLNRPKLQEMLDFVREGDTIFIHDFSRISRSVKDLLSLILYLFLFHYKEIHVRRFALYSVLASEVFYIYLFPIEKMDIYQLRDLFQNLVNKYSLNNTNHIHFEDTLYM